ncbi:Arc family DNA-binding protein [Gluconobacter wancherniae]|uniref:Arc family DNA-binding protein n=1 Tax=Gluconobacter wancherniae TaxID=1307955 RepID=UPI0038D099CF
MTRALLDRLKGAADARSHSMNAEIVQRLEDSVYLSSVAHVLEGDDHLSDGERALVQSFRNMSQDERRAVLALLNKLSSVD